MADLTPDNSKGKPRLRSVEREANRWFLKIQFSQLTADEEKAFADWLATAPINRQEFERASSLWDAFDALAGEKKMRAPHRETKPGFLDALREAFRPVPRARYAFATLAVAFIAGGLFLFGPDGQNLSVYETAAGETRVVGLADGSTIRMNTRSRIQVKISDKVRVVAMEGGEAFFEVVPDAARPFLVNAGGGQIRVVGTKFNVDAALPTVEVVVREGTVEVFPKDLNEVTLGVPVRTLTAGDSVSFGVDGEISDVRKADVSNSTAWLNGKLVFDATPLPLVVEEANRYISGHIEIMDSSLRDLEITGEFDTGAVETLLLAIDRGTRARLINQEDGVYWLVADLSDAE